MNDIVPELLATIQKDFNKQFSSSDKLKALQVLIDSKQATYVQANEYAVEVGEILANVFKANLSSSTLPEGKMYYNIAERVLDPTLTNNYNIVTEVTREIQEELNKQLGIGLKATVPKIKKNKIKGLVNRVADEENYDDVAWILDEPVVNFTQTAVNEVLEANAKLQSSVGLRPTIKRTLVGGACEWCRNLAGTYEYPDDVPEDLYRRHDRCRCTVEYMPSEGVKRQNVWDKNWQ